MANLSYQVLDDVLKQIQESSIDKPVLIEFELLKYGYLPNRDRLVIQQKLIKDGYIDSIIPNQKGEDDHFDLGKDYYYITFDGIMLLEHKGYHGKAKDESKAKNLLSLTTGAIAVGTSLAGLYALAQLVTYLQDYEIFPPFLWAFLCGVAVGLSLNWLWRVITTCKK